MARIPLPTGLLSAVALASTVALLAAGCSTAVGAPSAHPFPGPVGAAGPAASSAVPDASTATRELSALAVKGRAPKSGYARARFGPAWADVDHNGCDTRDDVLHRDLQHTTVRPGTHGCVVLSGTLADPYTGRVLSFEKARAAAVQIDHVVALSDAWQTGAQQWSDARRLTFANDPRNLQATDGPTNQAKGDADAASWLPPPRLPVHLRPAADRREGHLRAVGHPRRARRARPGPGRLRLRSRRRIGTGSMREVETRQILLDDGRSLEIADTGPAGGPVLLFHHGTPGSVHQRRFFARAVAARGWRLVTYSRAGYGASSRARGRSVADVVPDMRAVLDAVGVERAMVAGGSGGGPHALACAALMPDRTSVALTIAGAGAYGLDLDFLAGMGQDNVDEFTAALAGGPPLRDYLERQAAELRDADADQLISALDRLLPDVDRAVLTGEIGEDTLAGLQGGIARSVDGWLDDDLAFTRAWGFDLAAIEVPVSIWQGDADRMVPFAHGQWLAGRLPHARVHLEAGQGHLSITVGAVERMLDELATLSG